MQEHKTIDKRWSTAPVLQLALVLAAGCFVPVHAASDSRSSVGDATDHQVPRQHKRHGLEDRIRILTQWLNLDATQQSEVRKVLEGQREQVKKLWSDTSVPATYRINATQAISDKTADQIRALLNEEQRKKFNPPKQPRDAAAAKPNVEDWMDVTKRK